MRLKMKSLLTLKNVCNCVCKSSELISASGSSPTTQKRNRPRLIVAANWLTSSEYPYKRCELEFFAFVNPLRNVSSAVSNARPKENEFGLPKNETDCLKIHSKWNGDVWESSQKRRI